ncbi:Bidirectional sugar transporter SWEET5 [Galdieria sulphuraria]|nr:Bidirectional sugar transporter SWEET5 [Galdieria sulphuraria]
MSSYGTVLFLKTIAPLCGVIISNLLFLAPMKSVLEVRNNEDIGPLNPVPYCFIFGSTSGWLLYGASVKNFYICCHAVLEKGKRRFLYEALTLSVLGLTIICAFLSAFILPKNIANITLGVLANTMLTCFYASPLSTLIAVVRLKDASSLDPWLCAMNTVNGTMWTVYGFALGDPIVWSLNLLGAILGVSQLSLICIYGRRNATISPTLTTPQDIEEKVTEGASYSQKPETTNYGTGNKVDVSGEAL